MKFREGRSGGYLAGNAPCLGKVTGESAAISADKAAKTAIPIIKHADSKPHNKPASRRHWQHKAGQVIAFPFFMFMFCKIYRSISASGPIPVAGANAAFDGAFCGMPTTPPRLRKFPRISMDRLANFDKGVVRGASDFFSSDLPREVPRFSPFCLARLKKLELWGWSRIL